MIGGTITMDKVYSTKIPVENPYLYIRLFSKDGVSYFSKQTGPYLSKDMINMVDAPIRILANSLLEKECRIVTFFAPSYKTKEQINDLWNKIKREERIIKSGSLRLTGIDGAIVDYADPSYRTYWPSNEALLESYLQDCNKSWFVFDVPAEIAGSMKTRKDLFDKKLNNRSVGDYERFTISSDSALTEYDWRRYAQTIMDLLSLEEGAAKQ